LYLGCFILLTCSNSIAQNKFNDSFYQKGGKLYLLDLEFVSGFDTTIEAYSLRLGYGTMIYKNLALYGLLDITVTDGFRITTMDSETIRLNAENFGLGTSFLLRWYIVSMGSIRLFLDVGGGILYTFESFPPQGTRLNFTARPGVGLSVNLNSAIRLFSGVNRFHLSNGQGYQHPHNPAFDGLSAFVGLVFKRK
jgi:hypothetical protein